MEIKRGYSYHIKNKFFDEMGDENLMSNKENGNYRPHYYAIEDERYSDIYWMIPISSKVDKYKKIFDSKMKKYKRCNTILIAEFSGKNSAYLLQNAFPIKKEYIDHVHTVNNIPVFVYKNIDFKLQSLLKELLGLKYRGINLFFVDVDKILEKLKN